MSNHGGAESALKAILVEGDSELLDIKFCLGATNEANASVDQVVRQAIGIVNAHRDGTSREYVDF